MGRVGWQISAVNEGGHLGAPAVIKYAKTRMVNYKYRLRKGTTIAPMRACTAEQWVRAGC